MKLSFKLSSLILGGALASIPAQAVTIDELLANGGHARELTTSPQTGYAFNYQYDHSAYVKLSKVRISYEFYNSGWPISLDEDYVLVSNIFGSDASFLFYISDANGNPTDDGDYLCFNADDSHEDNWISRPDLYNDPTGQTRRYQIDRAYNGNYSLVPLGRLNTMGGTRSPYTTSSTIYYWMGKIEDNYDGTYSIQFDDPVLYADAYNYSYPTRMRYFSSTDVTDVHDTYRLETFIPNTTVTTRYKTYDKKVSGSVWRPTVSYAWSDEKTLTYHDHITLNGNYITFHNLVNKGYSLSLDNTKDDYTAYWDREAGTLTFDDSFGLPYFNINSGGTRTAYLHTVRGFDGTNISPTVSATFSEEGSGPRHNSGKNGWVTNGGPRRTYEGGVLSLGGFTFYNTGNVYYTNTIDHYLGTDITLDSDITLDTQLNLGLFGQYTDDKTKVEYIYIDGSLNVRKNDKYVKEYQLWMIPGYHSTVSGKADFIHDNGHVNGVCIEEFDGDEFIIDPKDTPATRALSHGVKFVKRVPLSAIPAGSQNAAQQYTFYVKAIYDNDAAPALTPTFHSLQHSPTPTSITAATADYAAAEPTIVAGVGCVTIEGGANTLNEVYTTEGALIYSGNDAVISLPAGLYIVRAGTATAKVAVR